MFPDKFIETSLFDLIHNTRNLSLVKHRVLDHVCAHMNDAWYSAQKRIVLISIASACGCSLA